MSKPGGVESGTSNADRLFFSSELEAAHAASVRDDAQVFGTQVLPCGSPPSGLV